MAVVLYTNEQYNAVFNGNTKVKKSLDVGNYDATALKNLKMIDKNTNIPLINSYVIVPGYKLFLYTNDDFTGTIDGTNNCRKKSSPTMDNYGGKVRSLKVVVDATECFNNKSTIADDKNNNINNLFILSIIIAFLYIINK